MVFNYNLISYIDYFVSITNFVFPSKEVLLNVFGQYLELIIISIIWIYSINILIHLYFSAINILEFTFIIITVIQTFVVGYMIFRALEGDEKFSLLKRFTIDVIAARGASFRNANLRNASFNQANLKNTDFGGAILINTYFNEAINLLVARIDRKELSR